MAHLFRKIELLAKNFKKLVDDRADSHSSDKNCDHVVLDEDLEALAEFHDAVKPRFAMGVEIPFSQLKKTMSPITDDGLILKEVLKQGVGLPIPEKSILYIHYDAFLEGQKEASYSVCLREKPIKFLFGDKRILPGLEIGIQTMKKDEISRIMVSPKYAFGEMGCSIPPQIPPNAEILFEVQILTFVPGKDIVEFIEMSFEDRRKVSFEKIIRIYECYNQLANDLFHKKRFKQAIDCYCSAVNLLEELPVANGEEDDKRKGYLLKLYLNLAQCFLNVQNPNKGIIYADLALKIDSNNPKGLYRMGKALYLKGSYERAEHYLCKAKQHKPFEKCVNAVIKELEKKRESHLDWERMFCKRMLRSKDENQKPFQFQDPLEFVDCIDREINTWPALAVARPGAFYREAPPSISHPNYLTHLRELNKL